MRSETEQSPDYHAQRKEEALKGVTEALGVVCSRLGYEYRVLYTAPDSSRINLAFARSYHAEAVNALTNYSDKPHLALNWGDGERVKITEGIARHDMPCIRVEVIIYDPYFDHELLNALWKEIGETRDASLIARWTIAYLEKLAEYYTDAIDESAQPLGWRVYPGYWNHDEIRRTSDLNNWEIWGRAPEGSRTRDVRMFLYPFTGDLRPQPRLNEDEDNKLLRRAFIDRALDAVRRVRQELEVRPLWARQEVGANRREPKVILQLQEVEPKEKVTKSYQGLTPNERIERMARAKWAVELHDEQKMNYRDTLSMIGWKRGGDQRSKEHLLKNARDWLARAAKDNDAELLRAVDRKLEELKRKN